MKLLHAMARASLALFATTAHASKRQVAFDAEQQWEHCIHSASAAMAARAMPDTVISAAFGQCSDAEGDFRARLAEWMRGPLGLAQASSEEIERQLQVERNRIRNETLSLLLRGSADTRPHATWAP